MNVINMAHGEFIMAGGSLLIAMPVAFVVANNRLFILLLAVIAVLVLALALKYTSLLVEQHVGFALRAAERYYVLESGRGSSSGAGGESAQPAVRAALSV